MASNGGSPNRQRRTTAFVFIAALALRAAFSHLLPLNLDEVWSGPHIAAKSFSEVINPLSELNRREPHPTLHYTAMWLWMRAAVPLLQKAGLPEESAVRGLAALFGAIAAALTAAAASRLDPAAGRLAGLLAAAGSYSVFLAQEARMYSMMECASALMLLLWVSNSLAGRLAAGRRIGWIAASFFLLQTHYNAIPLAALYWGMLALAAPATERKKLLFDGVILAALCLPWFSGLALQLPAEAAASEKALHVSSGLIIPYSVYAFSGGEILRHFKSRHELLRYLPLAAAALMPAAISVGSFLWTCRKEEPKKRVLISGALLGAAAFLTVLWLGSFKIPKLFRSVRYAAGAEPLLIFGAGAAAVSAWKWRKCRLALACAAAVWLAVNCAGLVNIAEKKAAEYTPWPELAGRIRELKPDLTLVYSGYMKLPLAHYGPEFQICGLDEAPPDWKLLAGLCPALPQSRRIAFVVSHPRQYAGQWLKLCEQRMRMEKIASFHGADLYFGIAAAAIQEK